MLGLAAGLQKGGAALLTYVKDNLKLYLNFTSNKSDTLKFPCDGSTSFDGTNDYIDCGDDTSLDITSTITISSWVYLNQVDESCYIIGREDGAVRNYILFAHSDGKFYFQINISSSTKSVGSTTTYVANRWYHVSGTYDGSQQKLYVDGVLEDDDAETGSIDNGDASLWIGAAADGDKYFNGKIANVGLWSRDLSLEEINSLMRKNYSQLKSVEKTSLVGWWALDSEATSNNVCNFYSTSDSTAAVNHENSNDEETLGVELVTAMNIWPNPADVTTTVNTDTNTVTMEADDSSGSVVAYMDGTTNGFLTSRLSVDKIYKITFNATWTNKANSAKLVFYHEGGQNRQYLISTQGDYVFYERVDSSNGNMQFNISFTSADQDLTLSNISVKEVTSSNGWTTTATTTTSVYGGNAPVLPRAVDVAREGEAEAIGDGSASFTASNADYIQIADNNIFSENLGFSVACWVKFDSISGDTCIISKHADYGDVDNDGEFYIINDDGACEFVVVDHTNSASKGQIKTSAFAVDTWYHLACTYDGGTTNGGCKIYINGIFQTQSDNASGSGFAGVDNTSQPLRIGAFADDGEPHDGNISQVGFWQGVLTQAKIQSLMESTSYAKIPASVKSTLGSELITFSVTDSWTGSNVSVNEASTDYAYSGTQSRKYTTSASGGVDGITSNTFTTVLNSLYKLDCWVYSPSQGDITVRVLQGDGSGYSLDEEVTIATGSWVNIIRYFKELGGGASSEFFVGNNLGSAVTQYVDNVSVKLVTNDLVGYWALDADNSNTSNGAGITNDLTTGETLSSELVGDASFDSGGGTNITISNATDTEVTGGALVYTDGSASDVTFLKSSGNILTSGNIYKLVFTIADTASHGRIKITFDENSATGSSYSDHQNYANGTHTLYTVAGQANAVINISASSPSFKMTDVSIKKVTSNTGVLK